MLPGNREYTPQIPNRVSQGQDIRATGSRDSGAFKPSPSSHLVPLPTPDSGHIQMGLEFPMLDPFYRCPGSKISIPGAIPVNSGLPNCWPPTSTSHGDNVGVGTRLFVTNVNSSSSGSQEWRASEQNDEIEAPVTQPNGTAKIMLFGVNIGNSLAELPSPQFATLIEPQSPCSVPPTTSQSSSETIHVSDPSKSIAGILSEKQCKNCCSVTNRSCTKVFHLLEFV